MKVYSLKKKRNTEELHLFRATPTQNQQCMPESESICGGMKNSESIEARFTCQSDDYARKKCAEIGRKVCGTCISHLYNTYK